MGSFLAIIRDELPKNLFEIALSAFGFLVALGVNGIVEKIHDRNTFCSMLTAFRSEAASNTNVITDSYDKLLPDGVVLNEFRIATAQSLLASPLAMNYLTDTDIKSINRYVTDLALANGQRRVVELLTFNPTPSSTPWLESAREVLGNSVKVAGKDIESVLAIKGSGLL